MKNIRHPSNNTTVEPPKNWARRHPMIPLKPTMCTSGHTDGVQVLISWWEPSPEEIAVLLRGGKIQIGCIGGMPGMKVEVVEEPGAISVMVAH